MRWRVLLPLFFTTCHVAIADDLDDRLKSVRAAVTEQLEHPQPDDEKDRARVSMANERLLGIVTSLEQMTAGQNEGNAAYLRQSLTMSPGFPPKLKAQILALLDALPELQKQRAEAARKEVRAALGDAKKGLASAADADALNESLGMLSAVQQARGRSSNSFLDQQTGEEIRSAITTLTTWQAYLRNRQAGYFQAAQNSLQQLLTQNSQFPLVSADVVRSEIQKLATASSSPASEAGVILKSVKKAEEIEAAAQSISALTEGNRNEGSLQGIAQRMRNFASIYAASLYGLPNDASGTSFAGDTTNPLLPEIMRIENLLRMEVLVRNFSGLKVEPPQEGENQKDYLNRLLTAAKAAKDWALMERLLDVSSRSFGRPEFGNNLADQLAGIRSFISAQELEAAGQYAPAIQAYRRVLSGSGAQLPTEEASEWLRALTEAHKDAVEQVDKEEQIRAIVKSVLESSPGRRYPPY